MPFNAGGQTYIGGPLLAQGLGNLGQGIGGGIMQALEEQRKKQQLTDQIMLQALQTGHATPEQYLEYSKKNTKGKQDYAMTVAANFADEYKERVKEQHQKITADIAQSNAAAAASQAQTTHAKQLTDIANQTLSDPGPTPEEELRRNKYGMVTVWEPGKGWQVRDMTGSTAKTPSPYANTPVWSQDGKRIIGEHDASGTPHYYPEGELERQAGEGGDTIKAVGVPDPFRPGQFLPDKVAIIGPGKTRSIEDYDLGTGSPYFIDKETGILTYKKSRKAVEGAAVQSAFLTKKLGIQGGAGADTGTSGGAGDLGSGVPSTLGNIINSTGIKQIWDAYSGGGGPMPSPTPLDAIINQISPTPTATPAETPSATPSPTPLDAIINAISPTPTGTPSATPTASPLDAIVKKIATTAKTGAKKTLSQKDKDALKWARENPRDPRAAAIFQKLGIE